MLVPLHNTEQLLSDILCATHAPCLKIVLVAPLDPKLVESLLGLISTYRIAELARLPSIVYLQKSQMVAFRLMEFGFFRICLRLLVFGSVEDVACSKHADDCENLLRAAKLD